MILRESYSPCIISRRVLNVFLTVGTELPISFQCAYPEEWETWRVADLGVILGASRLGVKRPNSCHFLLLGKYPKIQPHYKDILAALERLHSHPT